MPKGIYENIRCDIKKKEGFTTTEHQEDAKKAFLESPYKGMLLYHELGSGKTCTSIIIADELLEKKKINKVYVFSPGSLRSNFIKEYCEKCGNSSVSLRKNYIFITYNYNVYPHLPDDFSDSLVIIDEVHNVINGVKNGTKNYTSIYNKVMKSKCRVLALSGTPIYNYTYEFAFLANLLNPGSFPELRSFNGEIDEMKFYDLFNRDPQTGELIPKNPTTFYNRIKHLISYFPGAGKEFVPEITEMPIVKQEMSPIQEVNYWKKQDTEEMFSHPPPKSLLKKDPKKYKALRDIYIMAKKNILTRVASNFYYPEDILKKKDTKDTNDNGWMNKERFQDAKLYNLYSPKITAFLVNLILHPKQKHVLFTSFKEKAGVYLIKNILALCKIKSLVFSGDLTDSKRKIVLSKFNSENNRYGQKYPVLLVTEAGAEGISVLEARHMHILESSPRMSKTVQAIGRVARFLSHTKLPPEERNIKIWRYWSMANPAKLKISYKVTKPDGETVNKEKIVTNKTTIDEILYKKGIKTIHEIRSFQNLLKKASITPYVILE